MRDLAMHSDKMIIRHAIESDILSIIETRRIAILEKACSHYDHAMVVLWADEDNNRAEKLKQQICGNEWVTLIAEINNSVVGFGQINPKENIFGALYVRKNTYGKIGKRLLRELLRYAKKYGTKFLEMEASTNAEAFYLEAKFKTLERNKHVMASGGEMPCVKMRIDF
jgi:hypothetical protein